MRHNNSKEKKIEKNKKSHRPLIGFYSEDQKKDVLEEDRRKNIKDIEMEIFEHLKKHTKKVLDSKKDNTNKKQP